MCAWWESYSRGDHERVILVQFDLGSHSLWVANQEYRQNVARDRCEFAETLRSRIKGAFEEFDRLYWLGDGGVFACRLKKNNDLDDAVKAVDIAFDWFKIFQSYAEGAEKLSFRATATVVDVLIYPEASHWFSEELNEFLKYERELALTNAFVITDKFHKDLTQPAIQNRFSKLNPVMLSSGTQVATYIDKEHPYILEDFPPRFQSWLSENAKRFPAPNFSVEGLQPPFVPIGNSVIVDTAPTEVGYKRVSVVETEFPWSEFDELINPFASDWKEAQKGFIDLTGKKAAPLHITSPGTDDPTLYIEYAKIDYRYIASFLNWLHATHNIREKLIKQAFGFRSREGRRIPGSLTVHVAVIIDSRPQTQDRYLLLAHRVKRYGGFYPNCWSASYEEQFSPVKSEWGGRIRSPDGNLNDTVIRGLKEEFLSPNFDKNISVSLQAVFIDLVNLNLQLMAVVVLSNTTFSEVVGRWASGEAPDSTEHDLLAAIRIEPSILEKAISAEGPAEFVEIYSAPELQDKGMHPWHPSSQARIACCLWMIEIEEERKKKDLHK